MTLRDQAVGGMLWLGLGRVGSHLLDQVFAIILARLLLPQDFGIIALASVFTGFFTLFADMGLSAAIVQRRQIDDEYISTAFWGNVTVGVVLALLTFLGQEIIAGIAREPTVPIVLLVLSARFLLVGASVTQMAILSRGMRWRSVSGRYLIAVSAGGLCGVALALQGYGVWSLVGQTLTMTTVNTVLLWRGVRWRPRLVFSWEDFRDLWSFGGRILGSKLLSYGMRSVDNLLVGRYLGALALGFYALAYSVLLLPLTEINVVVNRVAFAAVSRLDDDRDRLRRGFLMATRYVGLISVPIMAGMSVIAPTFVDVLFGPKWHPAAPVIRILMVGGIAKVLSSFWSGVLQASGRPEVYLRWSAVALLVSVPAYAVGLRWGIIGVAWGYVIATYLLIPLLYRAVARVVGVTVKEYLGAIAGVMAAAGVMVAGTLLLGQWLDALQVRPVLRLLALILSGGILYGGAIYAVHRQIVTEFRVLVRNAHRVPGGLEGLTRGEVY